MKRRNLKIALFSLLTMTALLASVLATGAVFARGLSHTARSSSPTVSAQKARSQTVNGQAFNVLKLPAESSSPATSHPALPLGVSPNLAAAKQNASHNKNAPKGGTPLPSPVVNNHFGFQGMADAANICPPFGCQPPDMALATSPQYVFQGVNTAYELWTTAGKVVAGPVNAQRFFSIPNPSPPGCDPTGPFLSDPRAFYDPNTGYFWAAILQIENAGGVSPDCNFLSRYWIANFNPGSGAGCVYNFEMALGTTNWADYTQFGFSASTIGFTGNMFNNAGTAYEYAEAQFASKQAMEQCKPVTTTAYTNLAVSNGTRTVLVDTVQPVETETPVANDPGGLFLVNSFNINGDPNGNDCLTTACSGSVVWGYYPANGSLGGAVVTTGIPNPTYLSPPNADEPGCFQCVETIDTRITATPVYSVGGGQPLITFSLDTAVNNGGASSLSVVPGILWGQIQVTFFKGNPVIVTGTLYQSGYLFYPGDRATSFGAEMQDKNGNVYMVYDTMSASLNPSIMVASRAKAEPLGTMGHTHFIIEGPSATTNTRWGDYEAASYTGFSSNQIWVASQYSVSGDWNTFISQVS